MAERGLGARTRPTFRARLTFYMTLLAVAVLAAASTTIYAASRHILQRNLDNALLAMARTEVASSIDEPGGKVHVHEEEWAPITLTTRAGYVKVAMIKSGPDTILAQTANLASGPPLRTDPAKEAQALGGTPSFGNVQRGADEYRGIYYPLAGESGEPLVAVVAVPLGPLRHSLDMLLAVLIGALLLGGVVSAWGASRLARRLTQPLERIADAARSIGDADLSARIPPVSGDAELHDVTAILNDMLARLQAALQSQRRFVADASHELRSPLANLRGTVEVALRRPRTADEYRTTLTDTLPEIERLSRLVADLLTLSRADAGQPLLERDACDLTQLASAAVRLHGARAAEQDVTLAFEGRDSLPVSGDVARLRGVLDNLLDNALRHAPPGSAVTVAAARHDGCAIVAVRDRGPGIPPADQARVFERFYRTDSARDRHSGGLGLGLAIAKAVVDAHGGSIALQSAPGEGTTFTVSLPLADAG